MNKRMLKPYAGVLAVVLFAVDIFLLSGLIGKWTGSGTAASFVGELLLGVIALLVVIAFRGDIKRIFPFQEPSSVKIAGTLIFWFGCFIVSIIVTLLITFAFPRQMMETSQGVQAGIGSNPFVIDFLMVCVLPAVCEELAFRGALMGSLWSLKNKWVIIGITAIVFGIFHGSIWRFFPTAILGAAMGYLLFETGNMTYNMLFHMVNNLLPLLIMRLLYKVSLLTGTGSAALASGAGRLPLASVAIYLIYGAGAPLLIYVGNHLIHAGNKNYKKGLFPREKNAAFTVVMASCFGMVMLGALLLVVSAIGDISWIYQLGI